LIDLYLDKTASASLIAFNFAERAFDLMDDADKFDSFLRGIEPDSRQDVIAALEDFTSQFKETHVVPSSIVLLNLVPDLPDSGRGGMFSVSGEMSVSRLTLRLLKTLPGAQAVEDAVEEILPKLNNLSSKLLLIGDIGHREGRGAKLISEQRAKEFELQWRNQVRETPSRDLIGESNLLMVMIIAQRERAEDERSLEVDPSPAVTLAMLQSARSDVRGATVGNRAIRRSPRLAWDVLTDIYGGEEQLNTRVEELCDSGPSINEDLLGLARRYAGGWRPSEFGREDDDAD
jgi:hypothetical protein